MGTGIRYDPPELVATPVADHMSRLGGFEEAATGGIRDLAFFEDRLYMAYGDPERDAGPVELRSYDPVQQRTEGEYRTEERALHRLRAMDGTLAFPSSAPLTLTVGGRMYLRYAGENWSAKKIVPGAVRLHDLTFFRGAIWAAGLGAENAAAYKAGQEEAMLWTLDHPTARWTAEFRWSDRDPNLLSQFNVVVPYNMGLYAFGTQTAPDGAVRPMTLQTNGRDSRWIQLLPPEFVAVTAQPVSAIEHLILGYSRDADDQERYGAFRIDYTGKGHSIPLLDGRDLRILDAVPLPTGGALLLIADGARRAGPATETWPPAGTFRLWKTTDWNDYEEWCVLNDGRAYTAVEWREDAVYLATADGQIWMSRKRSPAATIEAPPSADPIPPDPSTPAEPETLPVIDY